MEEVDMTRRRPGDDVGHGGWCLRRLRLLPRSNPNRSPAASACNGRQAGYPQWHGQKGEKWRPTIPAAVLLGIADRPRKRSSSRSLESKFSPRPCKKINFAGGTLASGANPSLQLPRLGPKLWQCSDGAVNATEARVSLGDEAKLARRPEAGRVTEFEAQHVSWATELMHDLPQCHGHFIELLQCVSMPPSRLSSTSPSVVHPEAPQAFGSKEHLPFQDPRRGRLDLLPLIRIADAQVPAPAPTSGGWPGPQLQSVQAGRQPHIPLGAPGKDEASRLASHPSKPRGD
ncbi:unnamed protein product [Miscanthus lutarioriparius]|uniref:Uncharacterized protein n=1 Tax=Miscanthus lutarioriparius TaxID=422564 RepID=A0A811PQZ3_9POAL|nr:unnamed protein product [Miscanthus lutarioriparius]